MRPTVALVALLCAAVAPAQDTGKPSPAPFVPGAARGFNLLLVTLDTTRADRIGAYGARGAHTNSIDKLAREGVRFETVVTPAPITLPAHTSLMTCLEPGGHGVRHNGDRLAKDRAFPTLAETLRSSGYDTAAFVSAFVLDRRFGLDQGFDHYDDKVDPAPGGFPSGTLERSASDTIDAASIWLARRRAADRPFFAWVHLFDPHAPYRPPEPFRTTLAGRAYEGEIATADAELGRLLALLEAKQLSKRTLVVVTADHGEGLGEHGEDTHAFFLYDSTLRVPLILWSEGLSSAGIVVRDRVGSLVDLPPTLLTLLGRGVPTGCDGLDLLGTVAPTRQVYAESLSPFLDFGWAPLSALRDLRHKVIHAPRPELYDLQTDPAELSDLAEAKSKVATLRSWLDRLTARAGADGSLVERRPNANPEEMAALAALGYVGSGSPPPQAGTELADPKDRIRVVTALVQANGLAEEGRLEQALRLLRETMIATGPDRSTLWALTKVLLRLGREVDAEKALRELEAGSPTADQLLVLAQILARDAERRDEAQTLLDRAFGLDPTHGGIAIAQGDLAAAAGDTERAAQLYRSAQEIDPYRARSLAAARLQALGEGRVVLAEPLTR